jgi:hypothetical protein
LSVFTRLSVREDKLNHCRLVVTGVGSWRKLRRARLHPCHGEQNVTPKRTRRLQAGKLVAIHDLRCILDGAESDDPLSPNFANDGDLRALLCEKLFARWRWRDRSREASPTGDGSLALNTRYRSAEIIASSRRRLGSRASTHIINGAARLGQTNAHVNAIAPNTCATPSKNRANEKRGHTGLALLRCETCLARRSKKPQPRIKAIMNEWLKPHRRDASRHGSDEPLSRAGLRLRRNDSLGKQRMCFASCAEF